MESQKTLEEILTTEKRSPAAPLTRRRKERQTAENEMFVPVPRVKMVRDTSLRVKFDAPPVTTPDKALAIFREYFKDVDREIAAILTMDVKCQYINIWTIAMGGIDHVHVDPAEVFKRVLATDNAHSFIMCHNHPSGNPEPADEDLALMSELKQIGKMLNRPLRDFLILGDGTETYYSHKEVTYDL